MTLVFARVERLKRHTHDDDSWNPRALARPAAAPTSVSRAEAGASLAFTVLFLLWWFDLVPINHWLIWSRAPLAPAPVWDALTALIVALAGVNLVTNAIVLARKQWVRFYDAAFVLVDAGILFVLFEAMRIPNLILPTDATSSAANLATLLDRVLRSSLFIWALLALGNIAFVVWRWLRVGRQRGSIQNWAS